MKLDNGVRVRLTNDPGLHPVDRSSRVYPASADFPNKARCDKPDHQLVMDCQALLGQLANLLRRIEQAAEDEAYEHERLTSLLQDDHERSRVLLEQISRSEANTYEGLRGKHAVASFLLENVFFEDPSSIRMALLLSYLRDAQRLNYPAQPGNAALRDHQRTDTRVVIAGAEYCLLLMEELAAGFRQLENDDDPGCTDEDSLADSLLEILNNKWAAIMILARTSSLTTVAIRAKASVLRCLLETADGYAHQLWTDLARSYFQDVDALVRHWQPTLD